MFVLQLCVDDNIMRGHVYNSFSVGERVSEYTIVPSIASYMQNSLSYVMIDSG